MDEIIFIELYECLKRSYMSVTCAKFDYDYYFITHTSAHKIFGHLANHGFNVLYYKDRVEVICDESKLKQ